MDTVAAQSNYSLADTQFLVLLITILGTALVATLSAFLTYYFTRRTRLDAEWRIDKLGQYNKLLESLTDLMSCPADTECAYKHFQRVANAVALVAPQEIVNIMTEYQEELENLHQVENQEEERKMTRARQLLRDLVLAIRKDLRIRPKDEPENFRFYLRSPMTFED